MKSLRASARRIKFSLVSRNRKYIWLLLSVPLVTALLAWGSAASASCNFLSILASIGSGDGQVITPRAIAVDPSNNVFVADQNDRVQKFNPAVSSSLSLVREAVALERLLRRPESQSIGPRVIST